MKKPFQTKPGHKFTPCPKCGNGRHFEAVSQQVAEDCCEVWVVCGRCGHDPTEGYTGHRLEDVWGALDVETIHCAMLCREDALEEAAGTVTT